MTEAAHAFLAPSSAHIWGPGGCAYNPTMAAAFPASDDSPEAREGTAGHHLLACRLQGVVVEVGELDPGGTPITAEMFECTDDFVRDVEALRAAYPDLEERVEERVNMPMVSPQNWGTADWFAISRSAKKVWLKDFKFGHRYVDAWNNWQLADYLLGAVDHFMLTEYREYQADLAIYQPRCYHPDGPVKTWELGGHAFMDIGAQLASAAAEATGKDPAMRTGPYCGDCSGATKCPAFIRAGGNAIDLSMRGAPVEMDAAARGTFRSMIAAAIKRLEGMATGMDADIEAAIRSGKAIPGWELKPGNPRLDWSMPMEEVYSLGVAMGVPLFKATPYGAGETILVGPITPTQAIKAGIDEAVIMEYAKRPPAALKVVASDKTHAAKAFK
jgi:hypothetical protein